MSDKRPIESIIAADIGSTVTHVSLIDIVEGPYRFVAHAEYPTTLGMPDNDVTVGLRRAIKRLEEITQRRFLDGTEDIITPAQETGDGVDAFIATSNAAPPLKCVIFGMTHDLSAQSAQRACSTANALVTQTIIVGKRQHRWNNQLLDSLRRTPPDLIVMVGGVDSGPIAPLENAARVLVMTYEDIEADRRPIVIFAGNQEARRPVAALLDDLFDLRVIDNVRPDIHTESPSELQRELSTVYTQVGLAALPGYRRLRGWCASPILSTMEALSNTLRFIARRNDLSQGVLGIDVGGSMTYIGAARGDIYQWAIGATLGTSYGISNVLELSDIDEIQRWLPTFVSREDTVVRLENARLRPHGIPQTMNGIFLTHAIIRQTILLTMRRMRQLYWYLLKSESEPETLPTFDLIAARGGSLVHTSQDGLIALSLLDAIQPTGLTRLVVDWTSIWPQLGALAQIVPLAAVQVLERDGFRELGTVVAPLGEARDGDFALNIKIIRENAPMIEADIPAGTIRQFPLALDEQATVEVRPSKHFDIGAGHKGLGGKAQIRGGSLGVIVDTRGRPLRLSQDAQVRRNKLHQWLRDLIHDIDISS